MSKKKELIKDEFFTDKMGMNSFVFDTGRKQDYLNKGNKRRTDPGKVYHFKRQGRVFNRSLGNGQLRFT